MTIFFAFVSLATTVMLIVIILANRKESDEVVPSAVLGAVAMLCFIMGLGIIAEFCSPSIPPMDVYRGKTTLEITYRDGIAVDSTVVWKDK